MESHVSVDMEHVSLNDIKQTTIDDKWNTKLCLWVADTQIAGSIRRIYDKTLSPFTLDDLNRFADECIARGGLARLDDKNSQDGFVLNHQIVAEVAGLKGYVKKYVPFDAAKIFALLQWKCLVELRDEGHHSLLATGWFKGDDGKFYCNTSDPWPATDDKRLDTARAMTQRLVNGKWIDSRSIEFIGYYVRRGTDWL